MTITRFLHSQYNEEIVRNAERIFAIERMATGPLRVELEELLVDFVAGKVKPDRIRRQGYAYDAKAVTMIETKQTGKKGKEPTFSQIPKPMTRSDVMAVKLVDRDRDNQAIDEAGQPVKAFVRFTLADLSQVEVDLPRPKKPKTKKQLLKEAKGLGIDVGKLKKAKNEDILVAINAAKVAAT